MAFFTAIGAAIFGAGTFLAGLTAAALQIGVGLAINMWAQSMKGEPQPAQFGVQGVVQTGDDVPRSIGFGLSCTAGSKVYQNEWGDGGVFSTRVIALYDYPIRELRRVWVDGALCTLDVDNPHSQVGWPVLEYRKDDVDHLWVKFYDGTQTSADSFLVNSVGDSDRPYTSSRVGLGIAYVIVTSRAPERSDDEEAPLFQGFPQFKFETYGARLYDPSRDSSVGGSGTQRENNPATWGGDGDFLVPVQVYALLRGMSWDGRWLYGLQNVSTARLPIAHWIAQINKARASIAGPGGNEPTFRSGGEVQVSAPVHLALEGILTAGNGRIAETGGTYKLYVGEPGSAVFSFTDGDIVSTQEQSFSPFFSLSDSVNGVAATYPDPDGGWNPKTAPKLLRPALEALDGNRRLLAELSLDFVPYKGQVQRLMKWALAEAIRARRHAVVMQPEFWRLEPGDVVSWTSARNGYEDKLFRVDGVVYRADLDVMVDLTEVDPNDYDWDQEADYTPVVDGILPLVGPKPLVMTGWSVQPAIVYDNDGQGRRPAIEIFYDQSVPSVRSVRVQVRLAGETLPFFDGGVPYTAPYSALLTDRILNDTDYEVRGIFVRTAGHSTWSSWLAVTTDDIRLGWSDIYPPELDDLGEDVKALLEFIGPDLRKLRERLNALTAQTNEQLLDAWNDVKRLEERLESTTGRVTATYDRQVLLLTNEDGALSARIEVNEVQIGDATAAASEIYAAEITTLEGVVTATSNAIITVQASVDQFSAEGGLRAEVVATESGATSTVALWAQADGGDNDPSLAAIWLSAKAGGSNRVTILTDELVVTDDKTNYRTPFAFIGSTLYVQNARIAFAQIDDVLIGSALIEDNAIVQGKLAAGAIDTPNLFVDGVVITEVIAANQVTVVDSSFTGGSQSLSTSFEIAQTVPVEWEAGWVHIITAQARFIDADGIDVQFEIRRGVTGLRTVTISIPEGEAFSVQTVTLVDAAFTSATVDYNFRIRGVVSSTADVDLRIITVQTSKR